LAQHSVDMLNHKQEKSDHHLKYIVRFLAQKIRTTTLPIKKSITKMGAKSNIDQSLKFEKSRLIRLNNCLVLLVCAENKMRKFNL